MAGSLERYWGEPTQTEKHAATVTVIGGKGCALIRILAARACFRVSSWLAVLGQRLAGF
ncbi:hypothetical protein ACFIOY_36445 [Bradyrhizobium sp. TZ2]